MGETTARAADDAPRISGFLVVRDGIAQGYPFLEAITAALPVCDEFLVADGHSSDGTWEALCALRDAHPGRLALFRDPWRRTDVRVIAEMTNVLLRRCRFEYCFNVQANEIVHEDTCAALRALPQLHPEVEMFRLPFLNLMGRSLAWFVDFRRRLFRRRPYIVSKGDGYDVGYRAAALWRQPRRLRDYALHRHGERTVHLRRPIYRYRALFPAAYLVKLETRRRQTGGAVCEELEYARALLARFDAARGAPDAFWAAMRPYFEDVMWRRDLTGGISQAPRRCLDDYDPATAPTRMRTLFDAWEYPLAASLARAGG